MLKSPSLLVSVAPDALGPCLPWDGLAHALQNCRLFRCRRMLLLLCSGFSRPQNRLGPPPHSLGHDAASFGCLSLLKRMIADGVGRSYAAPGHRLRGPDGPIWGWGRRAVSDGLLRCRSSSWGRTAPPFFFGRPHCNESNGG